MVEAPYLRVTCMVILQGINQVCIQASTFRDRCGVEEQLRKRIIFLDPVYLTGDCLSFEIIRLIKLLSMPKRDQCQSVLTLSTRPVPTAGWRMSIMSLMFLANLCAIEESSTESLRIRVMIAVLVSSLDRLK